MAENLGKKFEAEIRKACDVPGVYCLRLIDPQAGYYGVKNPCDFIVYKYPLIYLIECKSVHSKSLPFHNITQYQRSSMYHASFINGVIAGVMCWYVEDDCTMFFPIQYLAHIEHETGYKSISLKQAEHDSLYIGGPIHINGVKKRILFTYNLDSFFTQCELDFKGGSAHVKFPRR